MKKSILCVFLALMMCMSVLAGCKSGGNATASGSSSSAGKPKMGGVMNQAMTDTDSLNPCLAIARMSTWTHLSLIYDTLVTKDTKGNILPDLAKSWTISSDYLTYTFTLRDDVTFHNGEKMDAAAVKKSLLWARDDPINKGGYAQDELSCISEINVIDDHTVQLKLNQTSGILMSALADISGIVYAPSAIDKYDQTKDQFDIAAGGSGPFVIDKDKSILGQKYVYEKYKNYWQKDKDGNQLPYLDGVVQTYSNDESVNVTNLLSGTFDYIYGVSDMTNINKVASTPGYKLMDTGSVLNLRVYFNMAKAPFNDIKVRQALTWAINGQAISDVMAGKYGFQLPWIVLKSQNYYAPADSFMNMYDQKKAKQLLADAGYPNGFSTTIYCQTSATLHEKISQLVQQQLAGVGIKANIVVQDVTSIKSLWNLNNPNTPSGMLEINTNIPRIDPWAQYNNDFGPASSTNFGKDLEPNFQALLLKVKQEPDQTKRLDLLKQLQNTALNDYFLKLLYNINVYHGASNSVEGQQFDFRGMPTFTTTWLNK